jgi:hypothetical protein
MHTTPAMQKRSDAANLLIGTAPWSRLPMIVTATGRKPMTSEVIAIPPVCTAFDKRM